MINLNHYLKKDHQKAITLNDNYEYYVHLANFELVKGEFDKAEQAISRARRMVIELRRLHENKEAVDSLYTITDHILQQRKDWF